MKTAVAFAAAAVLTSSASARIIFNELSITLTKTGADGVTASITGSGTASGTSTGNLINLNNFTGSPFGGNIGSDDVFNLVSGLTISGQDSSKGNAPYTSTIDAIELENASVNSADLNLEGSFSIGNGDTFSASGSSLVTGLSFSDLNVGTYTASTSTGDANEFGKATLNIVVPEPGSLALAGISGLLCLRRRRR